MSSMMTCQNTKTQYGIKLCTELASKMSTSMLGVPCKTTRAVLTVSYTHLDVYKRQVADTLGSKACCMGPVQAQRYSLTQCKEAARKFFIGSWKRRWENCSTDASTSPSKALQTAQKSIKGCLDLWRHLRQEHEWVTS